MIQFAGYHEGSCPDYGASVLDHNDEIRVHALHPVELLDEAILGHISRPRKRVQTLEEAFIVIVSRKWPHRIGCWERL